VPDAGFIASPVISRFQITIDSAFGGKDEENDCDSAADVRLFLQRRCKARSRSAETGADLQASCGCEGEFDHFAIDLAGNRLFATPEAYKAVLVFDLKTGNIIHKISGIEKPHAILYRDDLKRLYVTDGEAGDLKIADSESYKIVSSVKLLEDADSIGYDPATKLLYIDNGGGDVHQTYSMLSVVDTTAGKKVVDIKSRRRYARGDGVG